MKNEKNLNFNIPSPLEILNFYETVFPTYRLHIKRDDLIHPSISGNKWRKLKYHFLEYKKNHLGAKIVTCGGPWSNHILATATLCHELNIPCIGFIRGNYFKFKNSLIQNAENLGMEIRLLSNADFKLLQTDSAEFLEIHNYSPYYFIPFGGDDDLGRRGVKEVTTEFIEANYFPNRIYISSGTGATVEGLVANIEHPCDIHIFSAISRAEILNDIVTRCQVIAPHLSFYKMPFHRCKFGVVDSTLVSFCHQFYNTTGILPDPLYNGKMLELLQFEQLANPESIQDIMIYHCGGDIGWQGICSRYGDDFDLSFLPDRLRN